MISSITTRSLKRQLQTYSILCGSANHSRGRVLATQQFSHYALRDASPELVDVSAAPSDFDASSAVVYSNFASEEEADILVNDLKACLRRRRYEQGHWDAVIVNYKETELLDEAALLSNESQKLLDKVRHQLKERHLNYKEFAWHPCHAIDLHKDGELNAHVDSVRFSGDLVAGLSLISPSIMRLIPDDGTGDSKGEDLHKGWVDLYLPTRSLYVLSGVSRYQYSHQLLTSGSVFNHDGEPITVDRDQRLSVIFRDAKEEEEKA